MRVTTIAVDKVVVDERFYPRSGADEDHISALCEALRAGAEFPPILLAEKSHILVDGLHRLRATVRVNGDDAVISAVVKSFASEAAIMAAALAENAKHGKRLTRADWHIGATRAKKLGLDEALIAKNLCITPNKLSWALMHDGATKVGPRTAVPRFGSGRRRGRPPGDTNDDFEEPSARKSDEEIARERRQDGQPRWLLYSTQLATILENDMVSASDPGATRRLEALRAALEGWFDRNGATANVRKFFTGASA
jgi:hypothetical protein